MSDPVSAALRRFRGALDQRNRDLVNRTAADLIALRAPLAMQWQSVAAALKWNGEITLALAAIDRMADDLRGHWAAQLARANLLYASGKMQDALAALDSLPAAGYAPSSNADRVSHLSLRASILLLMGDRDAARNCLERAIGLDPRAGQVWLTFTEVADFRGADAGYARQLEQAWSNGARVPAEAAKLAHAVGRMRHQLRDYQGAFEAFARGAQLFEPSPGDRDAQVSDRVERVTSWDRELIDRVAGMITVPHDRVLFVSGLPRSGTTLVEQILVSHPAVETGEEYGFFRIVAQDPGGVDAASFTRWLDRGGDPNKLVELYFHLADERIGPGTRFVDKTVEAGNYMGLLLALFPKAPIFWLRRDPIDNGWSAFRTYFARGAQWSWDLADIGTRLAQEDEMTAFWSRIAGDRITFVDYEGLVRDPEPNIRRIAEAARLDPVAQMFKPHETKRTVATASVSQVREPINLKGLGVAEPYREWLGPMISAYEERRTVNAGSASAG